MREVEVTEFVKFQTRERKEENFVTEVQKIVNNNNNKFILQL